jgi:hypothetical protein
VCASHICEDCTKIHIRHIILTQLLSHKTEISVAMTLESCEYVLV